jgi:hypothetical protein
MFCWGQGGVMALVFSYHITFHSTLTTNRTKQTYRHTDVARLPAVERGTTRIRIRTLYASCNSNSMKLKLTPIRVAPHPAPAPCTAPCNSQTNRLSTCHRSSMTEGYVIRTYACFYKSIMELLVGHVCNSKRAFGEVTHAQTRSGDASLGNVVSH